MHDNSDNVLFKNIDLTGNIQTWFLYLYFIKKRKRNNLFSFFYFKSLKLDNNFSAINNGKNINHIDDKDCINGINIKKKSL